MTTPTEATAQLPDVPEASDPFRYGWRYVQHEQPDGSIITEEVPLRYIDLLHPAEGDHVTHNVDHQRRIRYLCDVFAAQLVADPTAVVLDDVRIQWDIPDLGAHDPDIMVILGVREHKSWSTFDVAAEATRPALIVEVTSPETRRIDLVDKFEAYDLAEVPYYIIIDSGRMRGQSFVRLMGYQRPTPLEVYEILPPDERGWLWLEPLRIWLGIRENEVYCFDEGGTQIGNYTTVVAALAAERQARNEAEAHSPPNDKPVARSKRTLPPPKHAYKHWKRNWRSCVRTLPTKCSPTLAAKRQAAGLREQPRC